MGLACGLVFYKIPHDMAGIRSTQAAFYLLCAAHSYLFFPFKASADTSERPTLRLGTGCWSPAFSWTVKCCITHGIPEHVIVQFLFCFIFSSRWVPRQNRNFLRDRIVDPIYRGHVGVVLCRTAEGFPWATLTANLFSTMQTYGSGFFVQAATIPVYVRWMKYVSYFVSLSPSNN